MSTRRAMARRSTRLRLTIGAAILLLQGSCLAPAASPPQAIARPVAPRPVPTPPSKATPWRADFTLDGPMVQGGAIVGRAPSNTTQLSLDGEAITLAPDGRFLMAFDRDAKPTARLVATLADGRSIARALTVAPRAWDISRLSTLPKYPLPEAEFERVRPAELAQINAARAIVTDAAGWDRRFSWPAVGRISTLFGSQRIYANGEAGSYHSGIDIALPQGAPVLAPADGVVIFAADHPFTLEGNLLMIDHGMGLNSAFLHLSRIDVHVGEHIQRGEMIGAVGKTGRATGPHLHWSLRWRDRRIDPLLMAGPVPATR